MEQTGIIRRIDKLGRIVVPKEFRKALNIEITDSVEIVLVDDRVEIKKHDTRCIFCGCKDHLIEMLGKKICRACRDKIM